MSDYVYSELNRNLVNVDYEGVKTDSAKVTVDNGKRTIAVDFTRLPKSLFIEDGSAIREYNGFEELRININDYFIREIETTEFAKKYALFIGDSEVVQGSSIEIPFSDSLKGVAMNMCETAGIPLSGLAVGDFYLEFTLDSGKLFCALGGLQSFANNKVEAEKTRAMAAESELSGDLADESARASLAEEALSNRLIAEESARESGDRELSGYISDETAARQAADSALSDRVTALENGGAAITVEIETKVGEERARAEEAEGIISDNLAAEESARASADASLSTRITDEQNTRIANDNALQLNITSEASSRLAGDSALGTRIDTETNARVAGDAASIAAVEDEEDRAQAAETALANSIMDERDLRNAGDTTLATNLTGEINRAQGKEADLLAGINHEASVRDAADSALQHNIDLEETARIACDQAVEALVHAEETARTQAVGAEATLRANADTTLGARIDTEITDRAAAVLAEKTARQAADTELEGRVNTKVNGAVDNLTVAIQSEASTRLARDTELSGSISGEAVRAAAAEEHLQSLINELNTILNETVLYGLEKKVDKKQHSEEHDLLYAISKDDVETTKIATTTPMDGAVAEYHTTSDNEVVLKSGTPKENNDVANKSYADAISTALETYKTTVQNTYAPKSVLEVDSGKLDSIAMSRITKYKFIICHGYKFGVSEPNQAEFVLMPQLIAAGTADVSVYCSALGSDSDAGWPFKIRFSCSADGQTLSWYTYPTYGDSSEKGKFYITQILGVY